MSRRQWGGILLGTGAVAAVALVIMLINLRSPAPLRYRIDLEDRGTRLSTVTVYYLHPQTQALVARDREVLGGRPRREVAANLVDYLSQGSGELAPVLPPGTRLLHFFVTGDGEAILDLSAQVQSVRAAGILEERRKLTAISRTMAENLEGVERVRLLVLGRPLDRWATHLRPGSMAEAETP
jgi:hypothetical protein